MYTVAVSLRPLKHVKLTSKSKLLNILSLRIFNSFIQTSGSGTHACDLQDLCLLHRYHGAVRISKYTNFELQLDKKT